MNNEAIYSWNLEFSLLGILNTDSIVFFFYIGLVTFSMSSWVSSGSLYFLYIFLFHLWYLMVGVQLFIVFSYKPAMWETWVQSLGWENPLEKGKALIPVFWPGEFHGQSMDSQRVRHDCDFYFHKPFNLCKLIVKSIFIPVFRELNLHSFLAYLVESISIHGPF